MPVARKLLWLHLSEYQTRERRTGRSGGGRDLVARAPRFGRPYGAKAAICSLRS